MNLEKIRKLYDAATPVCGPAFITAAEASFYNASRTLLPKLLAVAEAAKAHAEALGTEINEGAVFSEPLKQRLVRLTTETLKRQLAALESDA